MPHHRHVISGSEPARVTPAPALFRLRRWLLGALGLGASALSACHIGNCKEPGYREGEQLRITVLSKEDGVCNVAPLAAGDSFVLTGGASVQTADGCTVRPASPEVPSFATSLVMSCQEANMQLALDCTGTMGVAGCDALAQMRLGPYVAPGVTTIDPATFTIVWTASGCPSGSCRETYRVRVDRLP
jgi:hypothetical protein